MRSSFPIRSVLHSIPWLPRIACLVMILITAGQHVRGDEPPLEPIPLPQPVAEKLPDSPTPAVPASETVPLAPTPLINLDDEPTPADPGEVETGGELILEGPAFPDQGNSVPAIPQNGDLQPIPSQPEASWTIAPPSADKTSPVVPNPAPPVTNNQRTQGVPSTPSLGTSPRGVYPPANSGTITRRSTTTYYQARPAVVTGTVVRTWVGPDGVMYRETTQGYPVATGTTLIITQQPRIVTGFVPGLPRPPFPGMMMPPGPPMLGPPPVPPFMPPRPFRAAMMRSMRP